VDPSAATLPADEVFRDLVRTSQSVREATSSLDQALQDRSEAMIAAWRLGIGARTIAQVTDLTAARVAQIVEQELADDDADVRRRQNRSLSRTLERMNAIPAAHMLQWMISPENRYDVAVWTMAQHAASRSWTPEQLAAEMARHGWPPDNQLERTLDELVDTRRQIWRVGPRQYQIAPPQDVARDS
jgi:hypothetical protein